MLEYTSQDIHDCLKGRRVVFARDSTIRQIFRATSAKLGNAGTRDTILDAVTAGGKHEDLSFATEGVKLEFLWDPWLNTTALKSELAKYELQPYLVDEDALQEENDDTPTLFVLGAPGLWAAHYGGDDYFDLFKFGVNRVMADLYTPLYESITTPMISAGEHHENASNIILLAPVPIPAYNMLSPERQETITPERISVMNQYLSGKTLAENSHILWAYNKMTEHERTAFEDSGLHVLDSVAASQADLVLNARCNGPAAGRRDAAHRGTCCMVYPRGRFETAFLNLSIDLTSLLLTYRIFPGLLSARLHMPEVIVALGQLFFAVSWCQFSDRTTAFSKIARHYNQSAFVALSGSWFLVSLLSLGLFSWDGHTPYSDSYLSRPQSDEIKGLMQAFVLLYHYYYASKTPWAYKLVRLFMSGYFFLSAFGHSMYFLKKRDFSFGRLATVVFRLNALSALLPYAVDTDYDSYYFAPAITFWYLVVYLTHRIYWVYNQDLFYFLPKVIAAAILVNVFIFTPGLLEFLSRTSYTIFRMTWDVADMRFRLGLDRYVVFIGIIVASLVQRTARFRAHHRQGTLGTFTGYPYGERVPIVDGVLRAIAESKPAWTALKPAILLLCAAVLCTFPILASADSLHSKEAYNALHPYISWLPVVAFLALRNACAWLRARSMRLPAALGRVSLETYVLQYHMWLGNDATARLTTGLLDRYGSPWHSDSGGNGWIYKSTRLAETAVLTVFFVAVATATHRATDVLSQWLFGPSRGRPRRRPKRHHYRRAIFATGPGAEGRSNSISSNSSDNESERTNTSTNPGVSASASISEAGPGMTVFEMQDLEAGGGRWRGSTPMEGSGGGDDGDGDGNSSSSKKWGAKKKSSLLLPSVFIRALSHGRRRIRRADILEDPKLRAALLLLALWVANWLYC